MCMVACATILHFLINGKLKSISDFFAFCKFMKEFTINLTDLYSPNNGASYNQVF